MPQFASNYIALSYACCSMISLTNHPNLAHIHYIHLYTYIWWDSHQSIGIDMGGSINGGTQKRMVYFMENPINQNGWWLGVPPWLGNLQMMYPGWKKCLPTGFGIEKAPLLPRTAAVPWARAPAAWPWPRKWDWDEPSFLGGWRGIYGLRLWLLGNFMVFADPRSRSLGWVTGGQGERNSKSSRTWIGPTWWCNHTQWIMVKIMAEGPKNTFWFWGCLAVWRNSPIKTSDSFGLFRYHLPKKPLAAWVVGLWWSRTSHYFSDIFPWSSQHFPIYRGFCKNSCSKTHVI